VDLPGPAAASPRATVARLPLGPGVYRFRDAAGRILYVGRAVCLRRRVQSYWGDLGDRGHDSPGRLYGTGRRRSARVLVGHG